jgi:hypothetical protein
MLTVTDRASPCIPGDTSPEEDFERPDEGPGVRMAQAQRTPYYPGRPIDKRDGFFGRAHEARTALSLLGSLQSVSLVGPRRIGKTSLLHHISNPSVLEDHGFDPKQFVFIFVGCAELSDLSRDQILQLLLDRARAGVEQANTRGNEVILPTQGITFIDFSNMLSRLTQSGCKLIFLFDEFRYMARNKNLDPAFFAGLRSIASNLNVAYVTASSLSLLDLTYANSSVLGSPFFNIFSTIRLGLFEDRDARDLIINPSRAAGLPFSDATVEQILTLADHHPFFLQVACFHAFDMQSQKGTLTEADHALLRGRVADELKDHFRSAWGRLRPEDRRVLLSLDTAQDDPANQGVLENLRNQCLVRCEGKRWALPCSLWADFVRTQALEVSPETPTRVEVAAAQPPSYDGSPETCTVSVQVTAGKQIAVEVGGAARYVPNAPSTWDVTDEEIALLKQAANRLFEKPEEWRVEARRIGEQLYAELVGAQPEIRDAFGLALGQRRPQDVHLRFKVPRDYLQLPLEFLHDGKDWLALKHPLAKFITGELVRRPLLSGKLQHGEELRVLLVAASVSGEVSVGGTRYVLESIPEVDYELEEVHSILQRAAARMDMRLQPRILRSDEAVYEEVRRELRSGGYDFFHYSGHASHDSGEPDHSALFLRKSPADGSPVAMTAGELKSLLENSSLRFAYFSCCAGATQADEAELTHNDFLGIVDAAVQAGLPSALGMRWPVNDKGARTLAQAFYEALFPSGELDSALLAARQAVGRDDITWLSPVLVVQA